MVVAFGAAHEKDYKGGTMKGITILNEFIFAGEILAPWFGIGIVAFIIGLFGLIFCPAFIKPRQRLLTVLTIFFAISLFSGISIAAFAPREEETRYQVIIDDSVNFNEFSERYEIISQEGLIYTITEKME